MLRVLTMRACAGVLAVSIAVLCMAGSALGQATNSGDIRGTVTDASGGVIPGAKVTVQNVNTGVTKVLYTNSAGVYDTVSILPGNYTVTISKEGFKTYVRSNLTIQVGSPVTVDGTLDVGATVQTVEVTAQTPLLKTENAAQGTNLQANIMTELPNVTRSWTNFTQLLPGVSPSSTFRQADYRLVINGTLPNYNSFLADGASAMLPHSSNLAYETDFAAIAEVQIDTSTFSAEYGNGGAVFNQISKNGTNHWHGEGYEFNQNTDLNARSFFQTTPPITHFNNFGGAVGGPIRKNKAFFFFAVDKIINNSSYASFYTFPTDAMRNGDFSNSIFPTIYDPQNVSGGLRTAFTGNKIPPGQMDPLALAVQKYFPPPNLAGVENNYLAILPSTSPNLTFFGRGDYNITSQNRLTVSFQRNADPAFTPSPDCPIDCYPGGGKNYQAQLSDVWTFSPTTVNEFRFGWVRQYYFERSEWLGKGYPQQLGWTYALADMFPDVSIGGPIGSTSIGHNRNDAVYAQDGWDPSDTLTMIRGRHILHFGAEFLYLQDNDTTWGNINPGHFTFSGVYTAQTPFGQGGLGYADFLLGDVQGWDATNSPINAMREIAPQMFVQDDFKVTPHLTVNLGLRYQIQGGWHETHNHLGAFDPNLLNPTTNTLGAIWFSPQNGRNSGQAQVNDVVLPRVGFAWNFKPNWVMRGGFGAYGYAWSQDTYNAGEGFGASSTGSLNDSTNANPLFAFSATNPPLNYIPASREPDGYNGHSVSFVLYHTPVPRSYQWSLEVQKQFAGGMVADLKYIGSHTNGLGFPVDINQVPESKLGTSPKPQTLRPYPQFLNINGNHYNAISNYNSFQASLARNFSKGVTFGTNFTWQKMLDEQDSSGWDGNGGSTYYQNGYRPGANYGYSNLDRALMVKGYGVYQLPVGHGQNFLNRGGPADWILGGWQTSSMFFWESGSHFTPTMGTANLSGAISGNWFPDLVGDPHVANPSRSEWFNPAAFAEPAPFTFGNAGRNILVGPSLSLIDFSLAKSFRIPKLEGGKLQIRMDAINIINHPSFSNPNASIGTNSAGKITGTTVGGRQIQLGGILSF
jgi:Carboxypeptidase regulatory-like domain